MRFSDWSTPTSRHSSGSTRTPPNGWPTGCPPTTTPATVRAAVRSRLALAEPNLVAGRVAERAVPHAVKLIHRLLQDLGTSGLDVLEGRITILGAEDDAAQQTFGQHLLHDLAVGRGCVRVRKRRLEDDVDVRLALGPNRGPAHALVFDVVAHLEPEKISVEGERFVVIVDGDEAVLKFQVHAVTLRAVRRSRFFISDRFRHHLDDVSEDGYGQRPLQTNGQNRRAIAATGTIARVARAETNKAWAAPVPATRGPPTAVPSGVASMVADVRVADSVVRARPLACCWRKVVISVG